MDWGTTSTYILKIEIKMLQTLQWFLGYMFVCLFLSGFSDVLISTLDILG